MKKLNFNHLSFFVLLIFSFFSCEKNEFQPPAKDSVGTTVLDQSNTNNNSIESRTDCQSCQVELPGGLGTNISQLSTANQFFNYWVDNCFNQSCSYGSDCWSWDVFHYGLCEINDPTGDLLNGVCSQSDLTIVMNAIGCIIEQNWPSSQFNVRDVQVNVYDVTPPGRCMGITINYAICSLKACSE